MATTEHSINDAVAAVLQSTRHTWSAGAHVRSENTGALKGNNKRPDILIVEPNAAPVAIETEVVPAPTVEAEAKDRLGEQLRASGRMIKAAVAVRLPKRLRALAGAELRSELTKLSDLEFALFTGASEDACSRWPANGWLTGGITELSTISQSATVPPEAIEEAADWLVNGVSEAAGLLEEIAASNPGAVEKICEALKQEDSEQTRRMAMTIVANAFVFHEMLAGGSGDLSAVRSIDEIRSTSSDIPKSDLLREWRAILKVNFWAIFDIARRIVETLPTTQSRAILEILANTADRLLENSLSKSHDITGAIFQKLIADRKFLAAYYTTPASAALLVRLAIEKDKPPMGGAWSNKDQVGAIRVADFACGTGTLLSAAYQAIGQYFEFAGGNGEDLHDQMLANSLIGCDVMPAAAHLTASMLSGAHPTTKYEQSSIMTVPFGIQDSGAVALGSLDLLEAQGTFSLLSTAGKIAGATGEKKAHGWSTIPHETIDLVIMNPPFTRATGHEADKVGVPIPMFAAFGSDEEDQRTMSKAVKKLTAGTSAHGNAGEASIFLVLADRKLRAGGTLAMVMPLSLLVGEAWEKSRRLLQTKYSGLIAISTSGGRTEDMSFSADTGMAECMIVGKKTLGPSGRATFVVLGKRPGYTMEGVEIARLVNNAIASGTVRRLEDGPVGGTALEIGNDTVGYAIDAPLPDKGGWRVARIADLSLAQAAYQIGRRNRLWLPGMSENDAPDIHLEVVSKIAQIGPYHMDIDSNAKSGGAVRGPFQTKPLIGGTVPTYPTLWAHNAEKERSILVEPDREGVIRSGATPEEEDIVRKRAEIIWSTASHCHFNRDFQFNSQSTAMAFTKNKCIGGRAWPSISLDDERQEKALTLWGNCTIGLLIYWWYANKQQSGRGSIPITALQSWPALNVSELDEAQLAMASSVFEDIKQKSLKPLNEIDVDDVRAELDRRLLVDVIGMDASLVAAGGPVELLRRKLSREPSIFGGKDS